MAKKKPKAKQGVQVGLFEQEMLKPVDIQKEPPAELEIVAEVAEAHSPRLKIVIGSTKSCPHCGEDIKASPAGGVRCSKCWWFQLTNE